MKKTEKTERKLTEIINVIQNIAAENFHARAEINETYEDISAIAVGINMLAEEIEAQTRYQESKSRALINMLEDLEETKQQLDKLNKSLEQKVKERTIEIEKLLKQKNEFIDQLSHDLKNPLTPMIALLPIVRKHTQDSKLIKLLDTSINNARYMKDLVDKIIELAEINTTELKFDISETNLLQEVNKIIDNKEIFFKENDITVENNISEDTMIMADNIRLDELFDNLLNNAVKYMPKGGTITINEKKEKESVTVSVNDTGIGMTQRQIAHVFDEFYKADNESRHEINSCGLGLSICKRIVERHGGRIWAESPGEGKGSTFYFTLNTKNV